MISDSGRLILAFDVGGTQIKAAVMRGGAIIEQSMGQYEAKSYLAADASIAHFVAIVRDILQRGGLDSEPIDGFGLAFPGPFDYGKGICLIRGLGKFESLYGLHVGKLLEEALHADAALRARLTPQFHIAFENDAALFGLGEASGFNAGEDLRAVCLTVGTGLGSCFLENGKLVKHRPDVPENGWLYKTPYRYGIADEYVSKIGVLRLAMDRGVDIRDRDVRQLADAAFAGSLPEKELFEAFGEQMAVILGPALRRFAPDVIVIGGQISKSGSLFAPSFQAGLASQGLKAQVRISRDTFASTFRGIYDLVQ
ncbi:ROK family protein [Paenibacillus silvisoli]|uniref:ROK family protein n=1 Tax=Paenibacillus silvisoli TaxID=3110539 RepID=UPI002804E498|nr:ROK family protein [Paenibacillus silvisoli]